VADNRIIDLFRKKRPLSISYSENANDDDELKEMIWEATEEIL
jgi:hypothetical protein